MLRPRSGQQSRPASAFGIRHAQRLMQRPRRLGDVEGVDHQRVLTELGHRAGLTGQHQRAASFGKERAFLGDEVEPVVTPFFAKTSKKS